MTYAVVTVVENREKILGMIWAEEKSQAQTFASNLYPADAVGSILLRETECREVPLRLPTQATFI